MAELGQRVTDLVTSVRQDTDEIYVRFEDTHDDRALLRSHVNMLRIDRQYHLNTTMLVKSEARVAREACAQSMGCGRAIHDELQAYQTHTQIQYTCISLLEALVTTLVSHTTSIQTQLIAALGCIDTLEAKEPAHTNNMEDADSCTSTNVGLVFSISVSNYHKIPSKRTAATTTSSPMTAAQIKALISQGVANALAKIEANITSRNGEDSHDSGTGSKRTERAARECTYTDFLKCQPLNFKGTEGVVGLTQWFEKMESVFYIRNCTVVSQIKFATCTLQGNALTWLNSNVRTVGHDVAYAMPWKTLKKMMTDKYCPRGEIKKLEIEMWNFKIEKYVGGLPDMIHDSVMASKPKTMQDAIKFAT
ncbi:hypothetical protein Tco_1185220, partial [Tanacetum coccineum]